MPSRSDTWQQGRGCALGGDAKGAHRQPGERYSCAQAAAMHDPPPSRHWHGVRTMPGEALISAACGARLDLAKAGVHHAGGNSHLLLLLTSTPPSEATLMKFGVMKLPGSEPKVPNCGGERLGRKGASEKWAESANRDTGSMQHRWGRCGRLEREAVPGSPEACQPFPTPPHTLARNLPSAPSRICTRSFSASTCPGHSRQSDP